jgi:hypothetical protein
MALAVLLRSARYCGNLADRMAWSPADALAPGSVAIRSRLSGFSGFPLMFWSEGSCEGRRSRSGSIAPIPDYAREKPWRFQSKTMR